MFEMDFRNKNQKNKRRSTRAQQKLTQQLCCPEIISANAQFFPACCNSLCHNKVTLVPGERIVQCERCNRKMKPTSCVCIFECILEFSEVTLTLPLETLNPYLNEVKD